MYLSGEAFNYPQVFNFSAVGFDRRTMNSIGLPWGSAAPLTKGGLSHGILDRGYLSGEGRLELNLARVHAGPPFSWEVGDGGEWRD